MTEPPVWPSEPPMGWPNDSSPPAPPAGAVPRSTAPAPGAPAPTHDNPVMVDGKPRPRWNTLDTWPAWPLMLLGFATLLAGESLSTDGDGGELTQTLTVGVFIAVVLQQCYQAFGPWLVSKLRGVGIGPDWRFRFKWADIGIGFGVGVACLLAAAAVSTGISSLVDLGADESASNTSIVSDNSGSPWLIGVALLVIIGAPLTEELLFRGLVLRAVEKDFGTIAGVIVSTIAFALPHALPGATFAESAVLLATIATIGLIFAIATVHFDRLGPAIVGHFFFNLAGFGGTLLADDLVDTETGLLSALPLFG